VEAAHGLGSYLGRAVNQKLKDYLLSRGITEEVILKLSSGEVPDDPDTLRKAEADDPIEKLRKMDPTSPILKKIEETQDLVNKIKQGLASICGTLDRTPAGPCPYGPGVSHVRRHDAEQINGFALEHLLKGLQK
jgi:hypothetical protein